MADTEEGRPGEALEKLSPDERKKRIEGVQRSLVQKAAQDIYLLVAHLSRVGKGNEGIFGKSLELAQKAAAGTLSPEEELTFWQVYSGLCIAAKPTHVDSLYLRDYAVSLGAYDVANDSDSGQTVRRHKMAIGIIRGSAIVTFFITLIIVGYLSFIDSIVGKIDDLVRESRLLDAGASVGTQVEAAVAAARDRLKDAGQPSESPVEGPDDEAASGAASDAPSKQLVKDTASVLIAQRRAEITLIVAYYQDLLARYSIPMLLGEAPLVKLSTQDSEDTPLFEASEIPLRSIVDKFVLPFFAALLGVFVFILRTSTDRLVTLAFSAMDMVNYMPRIILGVIGGIVVSWFPDASGTLGTLAPAALAFVVGYSIEIFFNILDAMIKALGADRSSDT